MPEQTRKGRNFKVFLILGSIVISISLLIYFGQIAILYVISTIALIVLLLVVAFANLEEVGNAARKEAYGPDDPELGAEAQRRRADLDRQKV